MTDRASGAVNWRIVALLAALMLAVAFALGQLTERSTYDWLYLFATGGGALAVAAFTFKLWRSTSNLWEAARDQAALLQESVDVSMRTTSPFLFPTLQQVAALPEAYMGGAFAREWRPRVLYVFENFGKSPATVVAFNDRLLLVDRLPPRPYYFDEPSPTTERGYVVAASGTTAPIPCRLFGDLPAWPLSRADPRQFFLVGTVDYEDFFGFIHTTRFCLQLVVHGIGSTGVGWRQAGGDAYNERTKRKKA